MRIAWGLAAAYAAVYAWLGIERYRAYRASVDEGIFLQSIASAFHGFANTTEGLSHFTYHFSPILYLLAPLVWAGKSAIVLVVAQAVAGGLTIPPVYAIARRRMPAERRLRLVVVALYPALGGVSSTDFSENAFAPAAAASRPLGDRRAASAWPRSSLRRVCASKKTKPSSWRFSASSARSIRVAQGSALGDLLRRLDPCFRVDVWAIRGRRPPGGREHGFAYPSIRDFYGGGSNPAALLAGLFSAPKLVYVLWVLVPLGGICLLSRCMILALPGLAECLVSNVPVTYTMGEHYAAVWLPYVLVAFAIGIGRIRHQRSQLAAAALTACIAIGIAANLWASESRWSSNLSPRGPDQALLDRFIASLPDDASITAWCYVYAHLGVYRNHP